MISVLVFNREEPVEADRFPDGTLHIVLDKKLIDDIKHYNVDKNGKTYCAVKWRFENDSELFELVCVAKTLKKHADKVYLEMPYIPNARMDRVKNEGDVFTLKYFCEIINSVGFEFINVLDPHSNVATALLDNVYVDDDLLEKYILYAISRSGCDSLFFPDEGASKRYAQMFKMPSAFGIKNRDWKTRKILSFDVCGNSDSIKGKSILIVDDICCKGDTLYNSAKKLKEMGAKKISLFATHCENTVLKGHLLDGDLIDRMYTTDSIFTSSHPKIHVISCSDINEWYS